MIIQSYISKSIDMKLGALLNKDLSHFCIRTNLARGDSFIWIRKK